MPAKPQPPHLLHQFLVEGDAFGFHALLRVRSGHRIEGFPGAEVAGDGVRDDG